MLARHIGDDARPAIGCMPGWELVPSGAPSAPPKEEEDEEEKKESCQDDAETLPEFFEHEVMPQDTLAGLRIRYKVSVRELRLHNDFFGDNFRLCKVLRIPAKPGVTLKSHKKSEEDVRREKISSVVHALGPWFERSAAQFYLDMQEWNVEAAVADARADRDWEAAQIAEREAAEAVALTKAFTPAATEGKGQCWPCRNSSAADTDDFAAGQTPTSLNRRARSSAGAKVIAVELTTFATTPASIIVGGH